VLLPKTYSEKALLAVAQASSLWGNRASYPVSKMLSTGKMPVGPTAKDGCATSELLFAVEVIERTGSKDRALRAANEPFLTIGEITRFAEGIVSYYVHYQVLIPLVN
jgi:hypothetical protein